MKKLNLGCGLKPFEDYVNVDMVKRKGVDVVHNLEKFPYPFKNNEFDEVYMDNVLEHLEDIIKVMEELHRISKPNAIIKIIVPHYSSCMALGHITHKRCFSSGTFNNFEPDNWEKYSKAEFKILKNKLIWLDCRDWFFIKPLKFLIDRLINIKPFLSERFFCYLLGGFDHIYYELKVIKKESQIND
ncbi:methyltransferase domain-containing protein [Candidatus Pacearchaeota archaeon]|nr:methyltransferase domain-containing protein [Candidatus Pacearchaeota archaeon]